MSRETDPQEAPVRPRRRGRKRLLALVLLLVGLLWLNGPGWRWLGRTQLGRAFENAGLTADFELTGTLLGGIGIERLSLSGGPIRSLEIGAAGPLYRFTRALRGEIDGVAVERIHAVIDLAGPPLPPRRGAKVPPQPEPPAETLRKIRKLLRPMNLSAAQFQLGVVRGEERVATLDSSDFAHAAGSDDYRFQLGALAIGPDYEFPAQQSVLRWTEEGLTLDRFDLTPRLGVRDLRLELSADGAPSGTTLIQVEDARLAIEATATTASIRLEDGPLRLHEAAKNLAIGLPAEITVKELAAEIAGFDRPADQWTVKAGVGLGTVRYRDWQLDKLALDLAKDGSRGELAWTANAMGGELAGRAELVWSDLAAGNWRDFQATVQASVPRLDPLFAALKEKLAFAPADAPPLPSSRLGLDARIDSTAAGIRSATARWLLSAEQGAASIAGEASWSPDNKLAGTLGSDGLRANYILDLAARRYEGSATLEGFQPERLAAWAAAAGVGLPTGITATASWQGRGDFGPKPHRGSFELTSFEWLRQGTPPLRGKSTGSYAWPESITLNELSAEVAGQSLHAEATLADRLLKIPRIQWRDGQNRLVSGRAEVPVPADPADWRAFLRQELPLQVFLESEWIDVDRLAAWLPDRKSPLATGRGRVNLIITGSPAAPKIRLDADLKDLRLPDRPDLPATAATFSLDTADGGIALSGEIQPGSYAPVTLVGKLPFKPGEWAEQPGRMLQEKLEARARIPRLDLASFRALLPDADFAGIVEGEFSATGTLGKPELGGELRLGGGRFSKKNSPAPPITNANLRVRIQGKELRLDSLAFDCAGGSLSARGRAGLEDPTNPTLDFSARANALPLKRDESMIVRADAELALRGNLRQSTLSGSVELVDSLFYRDFELLPVRVPFTAPARPRLPAIDPDEKAAQIPAPFADWRLDVRVRTRDPLLIRGNLARGSAVADLRLGGSLGKIEPLGSATLSDVTARLPFSTLKVSNGKLNFSPAGGLNPELDIRGQSNIGRYDVNLFFYGPVNAPKTALTSDPPLPESEIMTLLATGTTSDGLEDGQAATMKAAQLFIEEWRRGRLPFGEELSKALVLLNNVDVRVGEDDPLTGQRLNSATIEITDRIVVSGSVDREGNTRVLGAFVLRFK